MEFPHGRNHHHHHGGGDDEEERRPPPEYGYGEGGYGRPPPPRPEYGYGGEGYGHQPPPRQEYGHGEGAYGHPPPPQHEYRHGDEGYGRPPPPRPEYGYGQPAVQHVSHVSHQPAPYGHGGSDAMEALLRQPTYRIYCKANDGVCLAIRDGTVLLTTANESDLSQHWIKDMKYSTKVKDEEGYPACALVNKATRQALKHSLGKSHPVQVTDYNPEKLEESVLWTESRDVGSGFRCIRMVNNIYLNFDALHGDKEHGGVHDGTTLVLWEWCEGDNQRWKIVPWYSQTMSLVPYGSNKPGPSKPSNIQSITRGLEQIDLDAHKLVKLGKYQYIHNNSPGHELWPRTSETVYTCFGCKEKVFERRHACNSRSCNFCLHPECVSPPTTITHEFFPGVNFSFCSSPAIEYCKDCKKKHSTKSCSACGKYVDGYCYRTRSLECNKYLHPHCANLKEKIKYGQSETKMVLQQNTTAACVYCKRTTVEWHNQRTDQIWSYASVSHNNNVQMHVQCMMENNDLH